MKKILKISVLVLIVAIVSVGLLAACEEPVTPGVPDVQQESNDVFYWAPVAGAEYYVMSVDDGENQTIAATPATVHDDNAEYAAMRFKLDTSALTAGAHSVKFAAGAGELVSEFGKSFRVVVGSGFVAVPEVEFNGDTIYVNTAAPTVDVTFTANNSPVTVTYERGVDDVQPIELNIEELLGSTELEDGVTYVVTAIAKDGDVSSDASRAVEFTYSAPDKQYAKPAVSLEFADEPYLIFNNDVTRGATVTFDLGGKYYSAEFNGTSGGSLTMSPMSDFMDDELSAVMIANAGTEMQFSFRVDYAASEPAIASEWSDPVTLSVPAVELEDWLDDYFDYEIGALGNGTAVVVDETVGTALEGSVTVEVKMNGTLVEATVGNDGVKVYKAEVSEGVNTVEITFTWGDQTYSVQEKFEVGEKVDGLHIDGSSVVWNSVADAEKYVVSVTGDPYGNAYTNEYETETTSFDFDEVASYDDYAVGMYEVTVYAVVDGVSCAESEVLSLRRAAAPQGYNLSESADSFTVYNDEYYNYNLIVKANGVEISHDTYNERNYIISKDRLYNSANGTLEIEFYYEGNDLDMLDSRPATYSFEVSDKLDYRIVDGDKIEIIGADLVNDYVYVNGTSYSAGSGYVTEDGMFEILDYVADNSGSVGIMGTVEVMPSFGAIAPYDVNLRAKGFTINVNSNRVATPSLTTDYGQSDTVLWDGNEYNTYNELTQRGKQGTWEYIIEYTDANGNSTSEADSGTIVNYDTCGASVDMSGFEDPGVYTISIRAKGTGNKFSSRYATATYLIFDEIDAQINTRADNSYVSVARQGSALDQYIAGYDYQYRYYYSNNSYTTTSSTYTTSLYTDGHRFSSSYMSDSSYNIASVTFEMNLSTNANYVFYKALPDNKTVNMDRIYVNYNYDSYDAIYYVTEGANAQAAWVRPELYTYGGYVYYTVMTRTENYSGWDYTSHYTTGSTAVWNNTTYVKVRISYTAGQSYIFSPDRVNGSGTTEVDYIFVKDGESILDALGKLNINTSYAFFTDSLCTTEVTKDLRADASSGSTTVYVGNAPVTA